MLKTKVNARGVCVCEHVCMSGCMYECDACGRVCSRLAVFLVYARTHCVNACMAYFHAYIQKQCLYVLLIWHVNSSGKHPAVPLFACV
jgi:hypothetical protein